MALSVEGPLRGLFLCQLPAGSTVHVIDDKDCILPQPFGKEAKTVTTSETSGHVFFKPSGGLLTEKRDGKFLCQFSGENQKGDVLRLSVNGGEVSLPAKIDTGKGRHQKNMGLF